MAVLKNFPALIFGLVCSLISFIFMLHTPLSAFVVSWAIGLVGLSLYYEKTPGWMIYVFALGSGVLMLSAVSQEASTSLYWLSIFFWLAAQIVLMVGTSANKFAAWSLLIFTVLIAMGAQAVAQLPSEVSKPDISFLILFAMSLMPTVLSFFGTTRLQKRWELLGLQTIMVRVAWVLFGQDHASLAVSVINFDVFLSVAMIVLFLLCIQTKWTVPASFQIQTAITLFLAQVALGAPFELSQLLLALVVPLGVLQIIGPQIQDTSSQLTGIFIKLDCGALGSPYLLALLFFSGYRGQETFPFLLIGAGSTLLISAQLWREKGPETEISQEVKDSSRIRLLSRYFFYVCAIVMISIECVRMTK
jgi:hypothetical protein